MTSVLVFIVLPLVLFLPFYLLLEIPRWQAARVFRKLSDELELQAEEFALFSRGHTPRLSNFRTEKRGKTTVAEFVFSYVVPVGKQSKLVNQSVVWLRRDRLRLPYFELSPQVHWANRDLFGPSPIRFESSREFAKKCVVHGDDEDEIRARFNDQTMSFIEQHSDWRVEGGGDKIICYREGVVVDPGGPFADDACRFFALIARSR